MEKDFTEFAPEVEVSRAKDAESTAYHEAGHAVLNDPALTGQILDFITIRHSTVRDGNGKLLKALGYASYKPVPGVDGNLDYDKTIALLAKFWAGRVAQEMAGFPADAGWGQDLKMMRHITTEFLTTWGLEDELVGLALDKDGKPMLTGRQKQVFEKKQQELMQQGHEIARESLEQRWPLVRAIVATIRRTGDINQEQAKALEEKVESNTGRQITYQEWSARAKVTNDVCSSWLSKLISKKKGLSH
jgi:ATP-dependent Zn protease